MSLVRTMSIPKIRTNETFITVLFLPLLLVVMSSYETTAPSCLGLNTGSSHGCPHIRSLYLGSISPKLNEVKIRSNPTQKTKRIIFFLILTSPPLGAISILVGNSFCQALLLTCLTYVLHIVLSTNNISFSINNIRLIACLSRKKSHF